MTNLNFYSRKTTKIYLQGPNEVIWPLGHYDFSLSIHRRRRQTVIVRLVELNIGMAAGLRSRLATNNRNMVQFIIVQKEILLIGMEKQVIFEIHLPSFFLPSKWTLRDFVALSSFFLSFSILDSVVLLRNFIVLMVVWQG